MIPHWKQNSPSSGQGSPVHPQQHDFAVRPHLVPDRPDRLPAVLSLATMAALVPQGILSLFTGTFADRFDRRWIMIISDGAIGLVSLMLAAAAFAAPLPVAPILAVAALRSVGGAFHAPCIQAITPLLAPPDALTRCAGWSQGIQTVSMLLSPALAAVLYARIPLAWILLLDTLGAAFAIAGVQLARLPPCGPKHRAGRSGSGRTPARGSLCCVLTAGCGSCPSSVPCSQWPSCPVSALFPLMSMEYFGGDSAAAALVETLFSAGMLAGSVLLGLWGGTRNKIITMTAAVLGLGLTLVLAGLLPPSGFRAFAGLSLLMGLSAPFFNSVFMALIQTKVEPKYLAVCWASPGPS